MGRKNRSKWQACLLLENGSFNHSSVTSENPMWTAWFYLCHTGRKVPYGLLHVIPPWKNISNRKMCQYSSCVTNIHITSHLRTKSQTNSIHRTDRQNTIIFYVICFGFVFRSVSVVSFVFCVLLLFNMENHTK